MWFRRDPGDSVAFESPPFFTTSIDAQAALPGRIVKAWATPDGMGAEAESGSVISECVSAPTERAARLAALLRAMAEAEA